MDIILERTPPSSERWNFEEVDEDTNPQLDDIHNQQSDGHLLVRV
jgi:hypothetical protein